MYNILCDSLGLTPSPNNGTLRLPLKPVGLHDTVPAVEVPSDPVTSYTITPTPEPTPVPSSAAPLEVDPVSLPTKSLGIDPVATGDVSNPVGVDPPTKPSTGEEEDGNFIDSIGGTASDFLEWAKDKFGKAWSWTTDKASEAWEKIQGDDGAEVETSDG